MLDNNNNEASQEAPEVIDNDTKEILDELEQEGHNVKRPDKQTPSEDDIKKQAEEEAQKKLAEEEANKKALEDEKEKNKENEDNKNEDDKKDDKEKKPDRTPKLMPAWKHKQAESIWQKKEKDLLDTIELLKNQPSSVDNKNNNAPSDNGEELEKLVEDIQENGLGKEQIAKLVSLVKGKDDLSPKISGLIEDINHMKESEKDKIEELEFNTDFDKDIAGLVKAEYPDISDDNLTKIKEKLHDLAYTEEYAKVPLKIIYKGLDDFREMFPKKAKSAEGSRGGENRQTDALDFENMTEEQLAKLSDADTDKYLEWVEKNKK